MRKYFILLLLFVCVFAASAQEQFLTELNVDRLQVIMTAMVVLGAWALTNILVSGFMVTRSLSAEKAHFYKMNIFWNLVNLALAIAGLRSAFTAEPASLNLAETVVEFNQITKILIFNAGLDVAYIVGGFLMKEMAKTRASKKSIMGGYGRSLVLQGSFLLLFDVVLFFILQSKSAQLLYLLDKDSIAFLFGL